MEHRKLTLVQKSQNDSISNRSLVLDNNLPLFRARENPDGEQLQYYSENELWGKGRDNISQNRKQISHKSQSLQGREIQQQLTMPLVGNLMPDDQIEQVAKKSVFSEGVQQIRNIENDEPLIAIGLNENSAKLEPVFNDQQPNSIGPLQAREDLPQPPQAHFNEVMSICSKDSGDDEQPIIPEKVEIVVDIIKQKKLFEIYKVIPLDIGRSVQPLSNIELPDKSIIQHKTQSFLDEQISLDHDCQMAGVDHIVATKEEFKADINQEIKTAQELKLHVLNPPDAELRISDDQIDEVQDITQIMQQDEIDLVSSLKVKIKQPTPQQKDKEFYKEMQKIKDRHVLNQPPKKPASAYIIFQKEKRAEILDRAPNSKVTEVVKEIARCWRELTKEQRQPYKDKARKDKDRYEKQIKKLVDISTTLKKPKKCLSAYMIFVKETRPRIVDENPGLGALVVMKKVGEVWQQLLMEEKGTQYFQDKADQDKKRYLVEQREFYDEVNRIKKIEKATELELLKDEELEDEFLDDQIEPFEDLESNQMTSSITNMKKRIMNMGAQANMASAKRQRLDSNISKSQDKSKSQEKKTSPKDKADSKPKKPLNAYQLFMKEYKANFKIMVDDKREADLKACELQKRCQNEWQILPKEQKQEFEQRALSDRKIYYQIVKDIEERKKYDELEREEKEKAKQQVMAVTQTPNLEIIDSPFKCSQSAHDDLQKSPNHNDVIKKHFSDDSSLKLRIDKQIGITPVLKTRPRQFSVDFQNKHKGETIVENNEEPSIKPQAIKLEELPNPFNQINQMDNLHQGNHNQPILQGLNINENILDGFDPMGFGDATNSPFNAKGNRHDIINDFSKEKYRLDKSVDKNFQYDQFDDINARQAEALIENAQNGEIDKNSTNNQRSNSQKNLIQNNLIQNQRQSINNQNLSVFNNILKNQIISNFNQQSGGDLTNVLNGILQNQNATLLQSISGTQGNQSTGTQLQQSLQGLTNLNQLLGSNNQQILGCLDQSNNQNIPSNQIQINQLAAQALTAAPFQSQNLNQPNSSIITPQFLQTSSGQNQNQPPGLSSLINAQTFGNHPQVSGGGNLHQIRSDGVQFGANPGNMSINAIQNQVMTNLQLLNQNNNLNQSSLFQQQQQMMGIKHKQRPHSREISDQIQRAQNQHQVQPMGNTFGSNTTGTFNANNENNQAQSSNQTQSKSVMKAHLPQKAPSMSQKMQLQQKMTDITGSQQRSLQNSQKNHLHHQQQSLLNQLGNSSAQNPVAQQMIQIGSSSSKINSQNQQQGIPNQIDASTINQLLQQHIILQQQQLLEQFMQQNNQQAQHSQQHQIGIQNPGGIFLGGSLSGNASQPQPSTGMIGGATSGMSVQQYGHFGKNSNSDISNTSNTNRNNNRSSNSQSNNLGGILSMQMGIQNNSANAAGFQQPGAMQHANSFQFINNNQIGNQEVNSPNLTFNGQNQVLAAQGHNMRQEFQISQNVINYGNGGQGGHISANAINNQNNNNEIIIPNRHDNNDSLIGAGFQKKSNNFNQNPNHQQWQQIQAQQNQNNVNNSGNGINIGQVPSNLQFIQTQQQQQQQFPQVNQGNQNNHQIQNNAIQQQSFGQSGAQASQPQQNVNNNISLNFNSAVPALQLQNHSGTNAKEEKVFTPSNNYYKD